MFFIDNKDSVFCTLVAHLSSITSVHTAVLEAALSEILAYSLFSEVSSLHSCTVAALKMHSMFKRATYIDSPWGSTGTYTDSPQDNTGT